MQRDAEAALPALYTRARQLAGVRLRKFSEDEAAARLPAVCPDRLDRIFVDDWYPEPPK